MRLSMKRFRERSGLAPWVLDGTTALAVAGLMLAILLSFGGIWDHVGGTDLHGAFLPKYELGAHLLTRELRLPLWNPAEFCGEPMFGVIQGAVLYPPVPLLFGTLSPWLALQLLYTFNWLVLGWGMLAYLRAHGVPRWATCVGFAVAIAGFYRGPSLGGIDHPAFLGGIAWIPLLLLCWERAVDGRAKPWLGWMAIAGALQWLSGYPDFSLDTAPLFAVLALVPRPGTTLVRRLGFAVLGLGLAALLAAIQLVPLAEGISESFRNTSADRMAEIRALFALTTVGQLRAALTSTGLLALALAVAGLLRASRAQLMWVIGFLYCVLANNPPFDLLYELPGYSSIRMPLGWLHIAPLFVGFLVAAAAARGTRLSQPWQRAACVGVAIAIAGSSSFQIWRLPQQLRKSSPDYQELAARRRTIEPLLDAGRDASGSRPRMIAHRESRAGDVMRHDLRSPAGYDPTMPPHRVNRLLAELQGARASARNGSALTAHGNPRLAALLGIGLVTSAKGAERAAYERAGFRLLGALPGEVLLLGREVVPRARIVHQVLAFEDEQRSFEAVVDPSLDHWRTAIVTTSGPGPRLEQPGPFASEKATIVLDEPEHVTVRVELETAGLLVLTDTWYPGWEARVDGERVPIWKADYAFRGVSLSEGEHEVKFDYRPASLRVGALFSAVAAAIAAWLIAGARSVRRRSAFGSA